MSGNNGKEIELITNPELQAKHMIRIEVLSKVDGLLLLPNTELATTKQVAEFMVLNNMLSHGT